MNLDDTAGVVIVSVRNGSAAQSLGFKAGDIIVAIRDQEIANVKEIEAALTQRQRLWQISVKRGERVLQLQVPG